MGLFSTLSTPGSTASSSSSSAEIPTVLQLYSKKPILLDPAASSKVTGYSIMSYEAVQVGSAKEETELKNRHLNPDLGVWNCQITPKSSSGTIDSLMTKIAKDTISTFCLTIDLSEDLTSVEPTLTLLQGALVRHLIENPPPLESAAPVSEEPMGGDEVGGEENGMDSAAAAQKKKKIEIATTSLYQLQATQFGLANGDKESNKIPKNLNESYKDVKTTVMICAVLPTDSEDVSESAYMTKQATALLIYHLRKFAEAIGASLCFVEAIVPTSATAADPAPPTSPSKESQQQQQTPQKAPQPKESSSTMINSQPTVTRDKLSQLWRDLAIGEQVWMVKEVDAAAAIDANASMSAINAAAATDVEDDSTATAIYGPGKQQEELIESVLLRNANYPGHWDATKDSLWVALPTPTENANPNEGPTPGDGGWLGQLRGSITADAPKPVPQSAEKSKEAKPKEKDAAVSSFFESLLKDP